MNATCESCGKNVNWHGSRGARLADLRCSCGGALKGLTTGRESKAKGKHYTKCALCGMRRLGLRLVVTTREWEGFTGVIPSGVPVCRWHEVKTPNPLLTWQSVGRCEAGTELKATMT